MTFYAQESLLRAPILDQFLSIRAFVGWLYRRGVREGELWERLKSVLGDGYAGVWADLVVLGDLESRTVTEALADGVPAKRIWRAAWAFLELPENLF